VGLFTRKSKSDPLPGTTHMQIVAHADDDLYFMNPDLLQSIRTGVAVVSVYLTAGEATGRNVPTNDPRLDEAPVDFAGYTGARYNGLRAAYAKMATDDRAAGWTRMARRLRSGLEVEVATLDAAPHVQLIFFSLCRAAGEADGGPGRRLRTLWTGAVETEPTLCPTGGPVRQTQQVTRKAVLASLAELLDQFRPAVVRIMDLDPDHTSYEAGRGAEYCDNEDHTAAAMFAQEALHAHRSAAVLTESYRGYWNKLWPFNLSAGAFAEKKKYLDVYGGADEHVCADRASCGDLQLGDRSYNRGYGQSTTYRFPGSTNWLRRGADGRLRAYAVLGGRAMEWRETAPASGEFAAPRAIGDGYLAPQLNVCPGPDGELYLVGMRIRATSSDREHVRDLVMCVVDAAGRPGAWAELGNPYREKGFNPIKRREVGMPSLVVGHDGHLLLLVRNFGSGLSGRTRPAGSTEWGPWKDLRGTCQDGIATVTTSHGRLEAYGATRTGVLRWRQSIAGGDVRRDYALPFAAPAGPPTVVGVPDGRLFLVARQPGTGWLLLHRQVAPDGAWTPQPEWLGGHGGFGLVAAASIDGGEALLLATRNDRGTVSVSWQPTDDRPASTTWTETGELFAHAPSIALDAAGSAVVAVIGLDSRLKTAVCTAPGAVSSWRSAP
jgi:LmbE family N-acetylglucosaminyl deacetylase